MLTALDVEADFIATQIAEMQVVQYAKTSNRSVVGVMNQFIYLAVAFGKSPELSALVDFSLRLANVPCDPLYKRETFPDRELCRWIWAKGQVTGRLN